MSEPVSESTPEASSEIRFADLPLSPPLLQALESAGYETATPIQALAIPALLAGRDVLGQAQTGTGKTAAFAAPLLQRIDLARRQPQVLVLTPTRELAMQVADAFERYGAELPGLNVLPIYGGQDYGIQLRQLDRGVHVVVGTPGRVMDHIRRGSLQLEGLQGLVLDEADEMLRMGFIDDVQWILTQAPAERQIALFSATMPDSIRRIAQQHLRNPEEIRIKASLSAETVRQRFVIAAPHQKQAVLARILEAEDIDGVLVFVKTKSTTEPLAEYLATHGHRTAALSSDVPQKQRERIVDHLRSGNLDVIIATDVAARGLDVQRISHVVNYDLPFDSESYVHRIGRTGRAGRSGSAILFVHPRERHLLRRIEQATRQKIEPMDIPSKRTINQRRVSRFHDRITSAMVHPDFATFASLVEQYRADNDVPVEQIAAALAVLAVGDTPLLLTEDFKPTGFFESRDANARPGQRPHESDRRGGPDGRPNRGFTKRPGREELETFRIEVGHAHQVKPGNIVGAIANETGLDSAYIGRIEIFDQFSTVDLLVGMPRDMFHALKSVRVAGQQLNISRLNDSGPAGERAPGKKHPSKAKGKPKRAASPS